MLATVACLVALVFFSNCQSSYSDETTQPLTAMREKMPDTKHKIPFRVFHDDFLSPCADKYFNYLCRNMEFNGNMLIAHKGRIIYQNSHGIADYTRGDSLSLQSAFQLASVSKQFTAVAVLMLYEQGKLALSDSIQQFFPDFPYPGITITNLLTHTSGLPVYNYFCEIYTDRQTAITNQQLIEIMVRYKPKQYYSPNTTFYYNNTNYAILAAIVEKVSGKTFPDFIQTEIFMPLGMEHTFIYQYPDSIKKEHVTTGYHYRWTEAYHTYQEGIVGDKGIYSTLHDLFIWDRALYQEKLLSDTVLQYAFSEKYAARDNEQFYGFGWRLKSSPSGKPIVYHSGWWRGYTALFVRLPYNESSIIILSNEVNRSFQRHYNDIINWLYYGEMDSVIICGNDTLPLETRN